MNYDNLKLKNQLCHPLYSTTNVLIRLYDPYLKKLGLTYPQYLVLMSLWEEDGVIISKLSADTLFDSGSLTPLLKKLEEKKFIAITPSPDDKRQKVITLTKKGEKLKVEAAKIPELMFCHLGITWEEVMTLKRILEKLRSNLLAEEARKERIS